MCFWTLTIFMVILLVFGNWTILFIQIFCIFHRYMWNNSNIAVMLSKMYRTKKYIFSQNEKKIVYSFREIIIIILCILKLYESLMKKNDNSHYGRWELFIFFSFTSVGNHFFSIASTFNSFLFWKTFHSSSSSILTFHHILLQTVFSFSFIPDFQTIVRLSSK